MPDMIESSGKLIEEELAKAGTDPELIGRLKKDRITVDKELPPMEFLLKLFDVPCCPRGELVARCLPPRPPVPSRARCIRG